MDNKSLRRAYRHYNRKFFNNELPLDAEIVWERMPATTLGYQLEETIAINAKLRPLDTLWRSTLIHEMAHLHLPYKVKHGPRFEKEMQRLASLGAFKGLW